MNKPLDYIKAEIRPHRRHRIQRLVGNGVLLAAEVWTWTCCLIFAAADVCLFCLASGATSAENPIVVYVRLSFGKQPATDVGPEFLIAIHIALLLAMLQSFAFALSLGAGRRVRELLDRLIERIESADHAGPPGAPPP